MGEPGLDIWTKGCKIANNAHPVIQTAARSGEMRSAVTSLLAVVAFLSVAGGTARVDAAPYMSFTDISALPDAYIGDYYRFQIPVNGGRPQYQFSIIGGSLPTGLQLDADGLVYGTPQSSATAAGFAVKIRARDGIGYVIEKDFTIALFYKASIYFGYYQGGAETNVTIDDDTKLKAHSLETINRTFPAGATHRVNVDVAPYPADNMTQFRPGPQNIQINDYIRSVNVEYFMEYYIEMVTEPPDAATTFPYEWAAMTKWYRRGETAEYTVAPIIDISSGKQYRFVRWQLPDGNRYTDMKLAWQVTYRGKAVACYDTYYWLEVFSPQGGKVEGNGWHKSDEPVQWSLHSTGDVSAPGLLGWIGLKLKPSRMADTVIMSGPMRPTVDWYVDVPGWVGTIVVVALGTILVLVVMHFVNKRKTGGDGEPTSLE